MVSSLSSLIPLLSSFIYSRQILRAYVCSLVCPTEFIAIKLDYTMIKEEVLKSKEPIGEQWFKPQIMIKLLTDMTAQYKEQRYEINKVAHTNLKELGIQDKQSPLYRQIITFCQLLGGTPRYFLALLNEQIITSQNNIITLNSRNGEIVTRLFADFAKMINLPEPKGYREHHKLVVAVKLFLNMVARRLSNIYQKMADKLNSKMQKLTQTVKTSRFMNNFLLYKIFRQLSEMFKKNAIDYATASVFRNCDQESIEGFYRYVINKFEWIKLFADKDKELKDHFGEPNPTMILASLQKNFRIEIILKEAISQSGRYAIFINPSSAHPELKKSLDDYLVYLQQDQLRIVNCKTLIKQWWVIGDLKFKLKLQKAAKEFIAQRQLAIEQRIKEKNLPIQVVFKCQPLQNFSNLDGVIGSCLFLMKHYSKPSDFFRDLSKRAILAKSIDQIMLALPIVGFFIAAGTFARQFYRIFTNHFSTDSRKLAEVTGFLIKTGATVGSSILGAVVGQTLIPIPIVGALLGTAIGALLGDRGWRKKRFKAVINYLRINIIDQCRWQCSTQFYDLLSLKQNEIRQYIPKSMEKKVFITLVCFILVCFHQSTRLAKFNNEKEKEEEQNQENIKKQGESLYQRQKNFEDNVNRLAQRDDFQTQFHLNDIIAYLQQNEANVYDHYEIMQKSILYFISKILP